MKSWQKGIELEKLQYVEDFYNQQYNKFSFSPFTEMNKPTIASLHENLSVNQDLEGLYLCFAQKTCKTTSQIKCFDRVVATKRAGDLEISKIAYKNTPKHLPAVSSLFKSLKNIDTTVWVYVWEEDEVLKEILDLANYAKVCSQYKSTAEIIGVYCNKEVQDFVPRFDKIALTRINIFDADRRLDPTNNLQKEWNEAVESFVKKLDELNLQYANHYSNYNKGKTWNALSLRGYSEDITFIEKPAEVMKSKKWRDKYIGKEFVLQNTSLWDQFAEELHAFIVIGFNKPFSSRIDCKFDRIRLMQLAPGGGELLRHSDLQDPDVGTSDGKTMRFHIPLVTNDKVEFSAWDWDGNKQTENFKVGELFYLDQRKPHTVVNNGSTNRIHLVFDVIASEWTRELITYGS